MQELEQTKKLGQDKTTQRAKGKRRVSISVTKTIKSRTKSQTLPPPHQRKALESQDSQQPYALVTQERKKTYVRYAKNPKTMTRKLGWDTTPDGLPLLQQRRGRHYRTVEEVLSLSCNVCCGYLCKVGSTVDQTGDLLE